MTSDEQTLPSKARDVGPRVQDLWTSVIGQVSSGTWSLVKLFAISFGIVFICGLLLLTLITPKYSARAVLGPQTSPQGSNQASGNLSLDVGGLGSLLGGNKQSENLVAFQSLLGTAEFARYLISNDHFDHIAFPDGIHHSIVSKILHSFFGQPVIDTVTVGDVQQYLQTKIFDQDLTGTAYVELLYANKDRAQAIKVLHIVLYSGDRLLRERETAALNTQISYLTHVIQATSDIEQLNLFRNLLGQKLASKVLVDTQETFAFKVFDAPFAPLTPNSPNLLMLIILLLVVAVTVSAVVTVGRLWWMGRQRSADR
jgi:hypothetical protein